MACSRQISRVALAAVIAAGVGLALAPRAQAGGAAAPLDQGSCDAWDVTYKLNANLELRDTPMGQGDGVFRIGPGQVVLRFENKGGQPGGGVRMRSYRMRDYFTIKTKTLFWSTTVVNRTKTRGTPDKCGNVAKGKLYGDKLRWQTKVRGYRTDGYLTCEGSLCGKFGAPPPGRTDLHIGPNDVPFNPFSFRDGKKVITMARTFVTKTDMPKQTGYITLAGREISRACVHVKPCK